MPKVQTSPPDAKPLLTQDILIESEECAAFHLGEKKQLDEDDF